MHRHRLVNGVLIVAVGTLLIGGWGCARHKTCQRNPLFGDKAGGCSQGCANNVCNEQGCASGGDEETEVLQHADPKLLEKLNNSPFARLMERRGRLGLCASCGRLGRFKEPLAEEQAPLPAVAKFNPVPTQPVFSPREQTMQPASYDPTPRQKEQESSGVRKELLPKAPLPEESPAPPAEFSTDKSASAVPRHLDVRQESSSWIFSTPTESKPIMEAQLPPSESDRTARRR